MPTITMPEPVHRRVKCGRATTSYEVLAEMTAMWKQSTAKAHGLARKTPKADSKALSELAQAVATRDTWEQAIMCFTGWNGDEIALYFAEVAEDDA
jgi:hypothetical protein